MKTCFAIVLFLSLLTVYPALAQRIPLGPEAMYGDRRFEALEQAGQYALKVHDYANAAADFRRASKMEGGLTPSIYAELGLALDYQGKHEEAFQNYRQEFGLPISPMLSASNGGKNTVEALARYGTLCVDKGLRSDAALCFDKSLQRNAGVLFGSLDVQTASPALMRALLGDVRGAALPEDRHDEAMSLFQASVKLAPEDPRPLLFLEEAFRHDGRFADAKSALYQMSRRDKSGDFQFWRGQMWEKIQKRWRD